MISRQRYRMICNNLLQAAKLLAENEQDYQDFLKEQGITPEEVEEIEMLETSMTSQQQFGGLNVISPVDGKMNPPEVGPYPRAVPTEGRGDLNDVLPIPLIHHTEFREADPNSNFYYDPRAAIIMEATRRYNEYLLTRRIP